MTTLKFKSENLKSFNKSIFCTIFFIILFFYVYIKMSKILSAKYSQENKERLQNKACERS